MLYMSGHAGPVGLPRKMVVSGGICQVVYVWACGAGHIIVSGEGAR